MAGPLTIAAPSTATVVSTTTFGDPVQQQLQKVLGQGSDPYPKFMLTQIVTQSILAATTTGLTFTNTVIDNQSGHSNTTNTTRWTCPTGWAGWYSFTGGVVLAASTDPVTIRIGVNGTQVNGTPGAAPAPAASATAKLTVVAPMVFMNVGDYVEALVNTSGSTVATTIGSDCSMLSGFFLGVG